MNGTIELKTERLVLRRHIAEDAEVLHKNFGCDPKMFEYSGWNPYATMEMAEDTVREFIGSYEKPSFYGWAICLQESYPDGTFGELNEKACGLIGTIGAYDYDARAGRIEVGISIERASWGKGYAGEALEVVLHYLTEQEEIKEVTAWCADDNIGSVKVMKKSGMELADTEKDALEINGKRYDKLIFSFCKKRNKMKE